MFLEYKHALVLVRADRTLVHVILHQNLALVSPLMDKADMVSELSPRLELSIALMTANHVLLLDGHPRSFLFCYGLLQIPSQWVLVCRLEVSSNLQGLLPLALHSFLIFDRLDAEPYLPGLD